MSTDFSTIHGNGIVIADELHTKSGLKLSKAKLEKKPIFVATRTTAHHTGTTLAGTTAGVTYRYAHVMNTECTSLQLAYANFYPTATSESSNANAITIAVSIEYNSQITRLFFNGERNKTLSQGGMAVTDPILKSIKKGETFYTRTWVSVPVDTNTYPQGIALDSALGDGKGTGDLSLNTGALTSSTEQGYGPAAIVGVPVNDDAVAFALIGDSIVANGSGDGWPVRAVQNNYGYTILSRPSSTVDSMEVSSGNVYRLRLAKYCTHAIVNYGTNDFNGTSTLATMVDHFQDLWTLLQGLGITIYHSTTMPRTTSTDSWSSIENQTPVSANSYNTKRATFNANLRGDAYKSFGIKVLDVAKAVETDSTSAGVWKKLYTSDGIHPLDAGINAVINSISLNP